MALGVACASPSPPAPPGAGRPTADESPAERVRFECAAEVQRVQGYDPGAALANGSVVGTLAGGAVGGAAGALVGLLDDIPGRVAAKGAVVAGGVGAVVGGQLKLESDTAAYHRGLDACVAAHAAGTRPVLPPAPAGLVEYRLRVLNVRDEAFTVYLGAADLSEGGNGPGLLRLTAAADAVGIDRGGLLYDRHPAPLDERATRAWGAAAVTPRVRLLDGRRDLWDEIRWHGRPGERSVWLVGARNRRPQAIRRVALSEGAGLAHRRPLATPVFGGRREAVTAVALSYLSHAEAHGTAGAYVARYLEPGRGISAVVAANDDVVFPDRAYLVVTHAAVPATYEAVLAWAGRGGERDGTGGRTD
ncbi:MAG TPA: hypothetical protein VEA38_13975 [Terriglobales bacterium]|nr:hypothetical protein [Terriglobales bacterium]